LSITRNMVTRLGYRVLAAGAPEEALSLGVKENNSIDLLLSDVVMPQMNGRDLAERLQQQHPDMKILFMSGYTADVVAHQGVLDKGVNFIEKPFSPKTLADKLREVLDGDRL
jgi:CheY-like chemotaxis protein